MPCTPVDAPPSDLSEHAQPELDYISHNASPLALVNLTKGGMAGAVFVTGAAASTDDVSHPKSPLRDWMIELLTSQRTFHAAELSYVYRGAFAPVKKNEHKQLCSSELTVR